MKVCITALLLTLLLATPTYALPAGTVTSVTQGAYVMHDTEKTPLRPKGHVYSGDTLVTDGTGRVRLWMMDDSIVSLGPDTEFRIEEYGFAGATLVFTGKLIGTAQIHAGEIANLNPDGISIVTPAGRVGIRGETVSIEAGVSTTNVYVEDIVPDE